MPPLGSSDADADVQYKKGIHSHVVLQVMEGISSKGKWDSPTGATKKTGETVDVMCRAFLLRRRSRECFQCISLA